MKSAPLTVPENQSADRGGGYPDMPRVAVGAVVFKDDRVLLVRRGKAPARATGRWVVRP